MKREITKWRKDGYTLRLATFDDAEAYYENNFHPLSPETARLTGCKPNFTHDEVVNFLKRCITASDRYDFLILSLIFKLLEKSFLMKLMKVQDVQTLELHYFMKQPMEKELDLGPSKKH